MPRRARPAVTVVDLNPWHGIDRLRDRLVARAVASGSLARTHDGAATAARPPFRRHPPSEPTSTGLRSSALCARGWTPSAPRSPGMPSPSPWPRIRRDAMAGPTSKSRRTCPWAAGAAPSRAGFASRRGSAGSLRPSPGRRAARAAGAVGGPFAPLGRPDGRPQGDGRPRTDGARAAAGRRAAPCGIRSSSSDTRPGRPRRPSAPPTARTLTFFFRFAWLEPAPD